ncbi:OLC1v1001394C2 [Oldenlandia corymbosa var. corymbosa]|uniref:OLC1v1001394C2 n=1 Tax=Oldenlandia corymbosa var. corymbosa TaxID=529605 RepID=A0AAV1D8L6_OLDCO|nr:OLC1v1001394C2 [Oldenlandia corymbosa var. corymbosa]
MYGRKGSELVKELTCAEPGQLLAFNDDLFSQEIEECTGHLHNLAPLIKKIEELKKLEEMKMHNQQLEELDKQALKAHDSGALNHHLSLLRNKRCLMTYLYNRADIIQKLGWTVDKVALPEEIEKKLSSSEKEYFKNHGATLQSYISELDLELAVDMVPPKDPLIKVRVLDEIRNVVLSDQSAHLACQAIVFLKRTNAEQYIAQGSMEELTG